MELEERRIHEVLMCIEIVLQNLVFIHSIIRKLIQSSRPQKFTGLNLGIVSLLAILLFSLYIVIVG